MSRQHLFWFFLGAIFFLPFLGGVHLFDWDEINFAEIAREMVVTGDFLKMQMNYEVFTEKPPLFFWLQALSMETFGVGEYAARLPNAILGILVLPYLYQLGKFLLDKTFGFLWALSWFGSILPFLYFKSGIIDPYFNFFIFNGILFLVFAAWKHRGNERLKKSVSTYLILGGISIGLGILTKGPVAYLLVLLTFGVVVAVRKFKFPVSALRFIGFSFVGLLVFLVWFAVDWVFRGPDFFIEFTIRQWELLTTGDAGHSGFAGYHVVVLLLGCFPASIFAISSFKKRRDINAEVTDFQFWMKVLFWVVLILFSLVGTKIIHYSSMAYYPLTFLSALSLHRWIELGKSSKKGWNVGVLSIGSIVLIASIALPFLFGNKEYLMPLVEADPFATANMNAEIHVNGWDYLPAFIIAASLALYLYFKNEPKKAAYSLFFGTGLWVFAGLIFFIGKVEATSQRANIQFFEDQAGEQVYVTTYEYKSYAPWFYARVMPQNRHSMATNQEWLLHGENDKPVRISVRINKVEKFVEDIPDANLLYEENGFYFYERPAFNK